MVTKKHILLTAWLILPLAVVVFLCVWIARSLQHGPIAMPAPRGQGAGQTGGANAIGERLAGRRADGSSRESDATQLWEISVDDRSGLGTADQPLYLTSTLVNWDPAHPGAMMTEGESGIWYWRAEIPEGAAFEFSITRGTPFSFESNPERPGVAMPRRTLPVDAAPDADGARRARVIVRSFVDQP
ncbi:MAG: hypothetical protein KF838_09590 [Phycisphaeraceae bacterium]|nr:MAG: hypothetical protein KF838_09590 [Phycisphaeraceae bacterium]